LRRKSPTAARLAAATSVDFISFCRWFATKAEWAIKPPSITTAVLGHAEGRGGVTLGVYSSGPSIKQMQAVADHVRLPKGPLRERRLSAVQCAAR